MLTQGSHVKVTQNRARETKGSTHGISDPSTALRMRFERAHLTDRKSGCLGA